ncbi:MAG: fructose-6-phosphate aldolase [Thermoplasmata archaeon]|nr:fructose-6-phosphate aldolase [Thermoplasmata archaeon]
MFLDTAHIPHIKEAVDWGLLDGVTTNPSLIQKEGRPFDDIVGEICALVEGPVNLEVVSEDHRGMVSEGRKLAAIHPNVVVKVPMTPEGLRAVRTFKKDDIRTNVTLVFGPNQALLAAKAGAYIVSPFIGRLDDAGHNGMDLIRQIVTIYRNYDFETNLLVASVRHPVHVVESALAGAQICTLLYAVLAKMFKHSLTDVGLRAFIEDWKKVPEDMRPF